MKRINLAEVYTRAAERVHDGAEHYGCFAINMVMNEVRGIDGSYWDNCPEADAFWEMFEHGGSEPYYEACYFGDPNPERQAHRILALLLMAEMHRNPPCLTPGKYSRGCKCRYCAAKTRKLRKSRK